MPIYIVRTEDYGDIRKRDDDITAARQWAKRALGVAPSAVSLEHNYRFCDACQSQPCCCMVRRDR